MHQLVRPSSCSSEELAIGRQCVSGRNVIHGWDPYHAVAAVTRSWSDAITRGGEQQHCRQSKKDASVPPPHQPKETAAYELGAPGSVAPLLHLHVRRRRAERTHIYSRSLHANMTELARH